MNTLYSLEKESDRWLPNYIIQPSHMNHVESFAEGKMDLGGRTQSGQKCFG